MFKRLFRRKPMDDRDLRDLNRRQLELERERRRAELAQSRQKSEIENYIPPSGGGGFG